MEMQAALEQAVVNALVQALGYVELKDVCRTLDGRPHPRCGQWWASVWSDGARESRSRSSLDETVGLKVTVTARTGSTPFDRLVTVRDEIERRLNLIRALLHKDTLNHGIINAAAALAGLEASDVTDDTKRIGYREALAFTGFEPWQVVGPEWFWASGGKDAGLQQTASFGRARRVQNMASMG